MDFATAVAHSMQTEGLAALNRHINFAAIANRSTPGVQWSPREVNSLFSQYIASMNAYAAEMKPLQVEVAFMNYRVNKAYPEITFRVVYADGHYEFYIATLGYYDGHLAIIDLFSTDEIEPLTDQVRRVTAPRLKELNRSAWNQLFRQLPKEGTDPFDAWRLVIAAAKGKNYEALLQHHAELLPELQKTPTMQALHLIAVSKVKKELYRETWNNCRRDFGDQTGMACVLLDAAQMSRNTTDALAAIDLLEKLIGEDRFFHYLRADVYLNANALEAAFRTTGISLTQFRRYDYRSRSYLYLCVNLQKWKEAATFLRELERDTNTESVAFLAQNPALSAIAQSEEFNAWIRSPIKLRYDRELLAKVRAEADSPSAFPARQAQLPGADRIPAKSAPAKPVAPYALKGIIYSSRPSATINNKFVMVGDKVGAAKVIAIQTNHVIIEVDGKQEKLTLENTPP